MSLPNAPLPFSAANADFVAEIYQQYLLNPSSVDPSWASFFRELNDDARTLGLEVSGPSWSKNPPLRFIGNDNIIEKPAAKAGKPAAAPAPAGGASPDPATIQAAARDSVRALMLIRAYRTIGHMQANLDPLGLTPPPQLPELQPEHYGFAPSDYDRPIYIDGVLGLTQTTLRDILAKLQATYCGSIGFEFMHLLHAEEKGWLQERIEAPRPNLSREYRISALSRLTAAEAFEKFLQIKFVGTKRFGLEGGEAMIPAIEAMIDQGTRLGLREVVVGMAHRGRLNMLTNVLGKPFTKMFAEFQGQPAYPDSVQGSGDVKYHMGTSVDRDFGGHTVHLTMNANPSHLEFVNPVVVGRVRAKQQQISGSRRVSDDAMRAVCALLIHGDAAFAGQGVVPETLMLSELRGYRTGGTIHFVINNQVGFTTSPNYSRSGVYCSDVAKMIQAPILHVNGDDVEAVLFAANLAIEYRQRFMHDMVIDMVCYRRHGHNESDEPAFTQPVMYKQIRQQPTTRERYAQKLAAEGSVSMAESDKIQRDFMERLEADFQASKNYKPNKADWLEGKWLGLQATSDDRDGKTGVADHTLREVGAALGRVPDNFDVNPKVAKQMDARREMIDTGQGIDWATAEALAFGTLLLEGTPVRLSGQDCGRGTFSQRHSVLHDQSSEKKFVPLNNIRPDQTCEFDVHDSPLSECAVMGFDYGFTLAEPNALVCWEGQFGDFANGAQVIIDQFISSAETKWLRLSGLTLLLPHGYEGQGPEHSSARLE
ncbi:MAG: 2-oxoglutarate dehydrogenase E1 component, partial [Alphaproteobacteria bacterium]|nr:2-oxoglutarate dehydrogenase E1 component [Alphaproteobacteria bacterium]